MKNNLTGNITIELFRAIYNSSGAQNFTEYSKHADHLTVNFPQFIYACIKKN